MPFVVDQRVVYTPNIENLPPPAQRPRDLGRILQLYGTYALVYFPASGYIAQIHHQSLSAFPEGLALPAEIITFAVALMQYNARDEYDGGDGDDEPVSDDYIIVTDSGSEAD